MIPTTLVTGANAQAREAAIAAALRPGLSHAIILEGMPDGTAAALDADALGDVDVSLLRIAPGCLCCVGNLVLRVTLNRILRGKPQRIYLSLVDPSHRQTLRAMLSETPYRSLLALTADLVLVASSKN